jgi:hypothetical protein
MENVLQVIPLIRHNFLHHQDAYEENLERQDVFLRHYYRIQNMDVVGSVMPAFPKKSSSGYTILSNGFIS